MNECLITKLKSSVADDSLNYLGCLTIRGSVPASANEGARYFGISGVQDTLANVYVTFRKGNVGLIASGEQKGNVVYGYSVQLNLADGEFVITIPKGLIGSISNIPVVSNGVSLKELTYCANMHSIYNGSVFYGDLSDLMTLNMKNLKLSQTGENANKITGDLSSLSSMTNMVILDLNRLVNITGNISSLGKLTALTEMNFGNTKVVGSIESLVQGQRANGRTSGSINAPYLGACTGLTFKGETIVNKASNTLSWNASTITLNGETINA